MIPAQEWSDKFDDGDIVATKNIRTIQIDALTHAAQTMTAHANSPTRAFNSIHKLIVKLEQESEDQRTSPNPYAKTKSPR